MGFEQVATPSLPCPYCAETYSTHLPEAAWMGGQGADPEKTILEMHMAECDRRDSPIATGFVEITERRGFRNSDLGLCEGDGESKDAVLIPQE